MTADNPTSVKLDRRPTHVLAQPGDRYVLCGKKTKDVLPIVWAAAVQAHVDGYGMVLCPACAEVWAP